jgi:hypothetical protein
MAQEKQPTQERDPNRGDTRAEQRINALAGRLATLMGSVEQVATRLTALERVVDGMKGKVG